ncbi:hypothetical protein U472_02645 [Orenia metallireducens]|uniref:TonB C-terminal domain-containing protein n=1 Tax=Orenia metallireducens TaxID=1413210 RepID=A0A1C0ACK4_9FIRM|nr:energy transducer TonB [Orenia metallireducens]OCL28109.1 hypothetical protein U472_02645 [Orenia metallireducens]
MKLLSKLNKGSSLLKVAFVLSLIVHLLLGYLVNKLYLGELAYVEGKKLNKESPIIEVAIYSEVNQSNSISEVNKVERSQSNEEVIRKKVEVKEFGKKVSQEVYPKEDISTSKKEEPKLNIKKKEMLKEAVLKTKSKKSLVDNTQVLKREDKINHTEKLEVKNKVTKKVLEESRVEEVAKVENDIDKTKKKVEIEEEKELIEDREAKKDQEGIEKERLINKKREVNNSTMQEDIEEVIDSKVTNKAEKIIIDLTDKKADNGVSAPTISKYNRPSYPKKLRRRGIEGRVLLKILIDDKGRVEEVQLAKSSGYTEFDVAAKEVVKKWEFNPTKKDNMGIYSWVMIPISFRLD